jgi:hypothetical protein
MRIEICTIGDELLLGYTIDTNGAHMARELAAVGISVARRTASATPPTRSPRPSATRSTAPAR